MRQLLIRILKYGMPTAAALGIVGYLFGQAAGIWISGHTIDRPGMQTVPPYAVANEQNGSQDAGIAQAYRTRLPLVMAGCGFGMVALFELLLFGIRGNGPKPIHESQPATMKDSTEELLNQLMEKAEAAEANRNSEA